MLCFAGVHALICLSQRLSGALMTRADCCPARIPKIVIEL
jgi:hypothetical protein